MKKRLNLLATLIVKVVNSQEEGTTARLNIANFPVRSARLIRLRANDGEDENSLPNPTNIYPTNHELSPECNGINVELPAYSLNIIRIKKLVVSDKKIKKTTKFLEH